MSHAAAIIVAAGSGTRLGAGRPKAFVALAGRPMVAWSLDAIAAAGVPRAIVAVPPGHGAVAEEALGGAAGDFPLGLAFVEGGAVRSASVRNALAAAGDAETVAVHDAARPLAPPALFTATLAALADADAAIAAARVADTIKEAGEDGVVVRDARPLAAVGDPDAAGVPRATCCGARSTSPTTSWPPPRTTPGWSSAPAGACAS